MEKDPREEKLPRWARAQLERARHRAATAEARLAAHLDTVTRSRIWYGDYENPVYVPEFGGYQRLHFQLADGSWVGDQINVGIDRGGLSVMAGRPVNLEPTASNCFRVTLRD